jgi:tetratricopeptide (TPR) repeat protein
MNILKARNIHVTEAIARGAAVAGLIATTAALGVSPQAAYAADTWMEIKAPHVTMIANGGTRDARTLAWQLEQIRSVLVTILPWAKVDLDRPFVALAVNNESRMRALLPTLWQGGAAARPVSVWVTGPDRHYLAIRSDERAEDRLHINPHVNAYFAYVSLVIQNSLQAEMPLWFTRGLAGVLSNTIVRDSHMLVGPPIPWHLRELRTRPRLRLATLMGATRESRELVGEGLAHFDAQAWALVHFVLFGDGGVRAAKLDQFFNLVTAGGTHAAAQAEAFGPIEQLEGEFVRYLGRDIFEFAKVPIDDSVRKEKFGERAVPPAEASTTLALFHVSVGQTTEARAAIAEARKAGGASADSHLAEALLLRSEGTEEAVRPALERAVAEGSTNAYVHYELARLQWQAEASPESLAAREKLLRRAAELNPRWSWTFALLADVRSQLGQADASDWVVRAVRLAPMESAHRLTAGVVLLRAGRHAEALKAVEAALTLAANDEDRQRARELRQAIERSQRQPPGSQAP